MLSRVFSTAGLNRYKVQQKELVLNVSCMVAMDGREGEKKGRSLPLTQMVSGSRFA